MQRGQWSPKSILGGERTETQQEHALMSKDLQKRIGEGLVAAKRKIEEE